MAPAGDMTGRVCLVTGATQGIGKVTARELARRGGEVTIVARSAERGRAAVDEIAAETGAKVGLLLADLSLMADVRRLAADFRAGHERLHVLINNAGAINQTRKVTAEGLEVTFATNHLAYFLLTHELLPLLEASGAPGRTARIVNVASTAHHRAKLDMDDVMLEHGYRPMLAYGNSKLCNILFTYELARRLAGKPVTANCLHPGVVATGFGLNDPGLFKLGVRIAAPFFLTAERGARTSIYVATSPEIEGVSGKYFDKCKPRRTRATSYDEGLARRLWDRSVALTQAGAISASTLA
jgi:NAD(P)-dependent dehydrogenase (short-subunit alcohol dehydrogenase family)